MEENAIYQRINNDEYETPKYSDIQEYNEGLSYINQNNNFSNNSYIRFSSNRISPKKIYNSINNREFNSTANPRYNKNYFNNYNPFESYNNFNENYNNNVIKTNYRTASNPNYINRRNNMNMSQDMSSPLYLTNNKKNSLLHINNSQLYNGYTTEEGESYVNYNRDSNLYTQNPYQGVSVIYPEDENLNTNESNVEQLIIYPDSKIINDENEKFFDEKTKEGMLKPKNQETYTVNCIEYIPVDAHKYKPITLGDYILKKGKKNYLRKNKSCNDINSSMDLDDYEIKLIKNKKKETEKENKRISNSCDHIYNIKTIKDKKSKNKNKEKKKISKVLDIFHRSSKVYDNSIKDEINEEKGGIVYFSNQKEHKRKYNTNYKINKNNYKMIKYPKWKITASACLIQSWWRGLKLLYKKYLNKIIIIQKVYKIHYKNKNLSNNENRKKYISYQYSNIRNNYYSGKKPVEKINSNLFIPKNVNKYYHEYPKGMNNSNIIYKKSSYKNIYNKPYINNMEKEFYNRKDFSFSSKNSYNNKFNIGILLLKKILENKLIKIHNNIIFKINNYNNKNKNSINKNNNNINNNDSYKIISNNNYNRNMRQSTDIKENTNLISNNKISQVLTYNSNENNMKSTNIYSNRNRNFLHLSIITPNNNISLTYDSNKIIFNPNLVLIDNTCSFSIIQKEYIINNNKQKQNNNKLDNNNINNIQKDKNELNASLYNKTNNKKYLDNKIINSENIILNNNNNYNPSSSIHKSINSDHSNNNNKKNNNFNNQSNDIKISFSKNEKHLLNTDIIKNEQNIENETIKESMNNIKNINNENNNINIQENRSDINEDIKIISQSKKLPNLINKNKNNKGISENKTNNINNINNYREESNLIKKEKNENSSVIVLSDKYKDLIYPMKNNLTYEQSLLLKKIFLKVWYKQAMTRKNAKRGHKKDKKIISNNNNNMIINKNKKYANNNHILLSNIMSYVFDKIKREIKRRKLIICFKNINTMKYPNLRYALKKIKKFSKVRFRVMNEYASIIQNAFRYYLENKNKEKMMENERNINNQKLNGNKK